MDTYSQWRQQRGFTLIELLVVIAIIGILASLIIISLSGARAKSQDTKLKNNLASITSGLAQYHVDNNYYYPSSMGFQVTIDDALLQGALASYYAAQPVSGVFVFENVTTGYGTPDDGGSIFIAATGLNSAQEPPVTSGSGVYRTDAGGNAGQVDANGLTLTNINNGTNSVNANAFVTYGPQ